jgi:hypothetical protein
MRIEKQNINLAGEYRVCSELLRRNLYATITIGNRKGADIHAIGSDRMAAVIEVKTANSERFVTCFYQKYKEEEGEPHPDFWVLFSLRTECFYVLSHNEMAEAQAAGNFGDERLTYAERVTRSASGVDNVHAKQLVEHKSCWDKILRFCGQAL